MASFADISIRFSADLKKFSSEMQNAQRDLKKFGGQLKNVGAGLSIGLTAPIVAFGVKGALAWDKQAKALAQVEAGLKSTGNAAGKTFAELQKGASDLQNTSLFGDEEILQDVTAQLLTFTNIAGKQFDKTQLAALNLATRLGGDLKGATLQLGKALNDPIANLSALSRSGIQFSEDQKAVIKSLAETGRLAEAQTIILDELEKQYGGAAEAAAKAGLGPFKQLSNQIGDLSEEFGKLITEALIPFVEKIKNFVTGLQSMDAETKKVIAVIAGLAAVLGPLLITIGYMATNVIPGLIVAYRALATTLVSTVIPALKSFNITMLANPVGVIVAAIGGLIYGFTVLVQKITPAVSKLRTFWNLVRSLGDYNKFVRYQVNDQTRAMIEQETAADDAATALADYKKELEQISKIKIPGSEGVGGAFQRGAVSTVSSLGSEGGSGIKSQNDALLKQIEILKLAREQYPESSKAYGDFTKQINEHTLTIANSQKGLQGEMVKTSVAVIANSEKMNIAVENLNKSISESIKQAAVSVGEGFGSIIGGFLAGVSGAQDLSAMMMQTLGELMIRLGRIALETAVGLTAIQAAFKTLNPYLAAAAGVALIAFGSLIKNRTQQATAFADGGIVYGPTMGLVGEYAGARNNPEVIAPLDKLKRLIEPNGMGSIDIGLGTRIKGTDLEIIIDRVVKRNKRLS